jgi:hypothetical protein
LVEWRNSNNFFSTFLYSANLVNIVTLRYHTWYDLACYILFILLTLVILLYLHKFFDHIVLGLLNILGYQGTSSLLLNILLLVFFEHILSQFVLILQDWEPALEIGYLPC